MEKRIGQQLREAREAKKLTLEAISFETKIPVDRLADLENDHLTAFGSMVYTRSFVKQYADFLGVDLQAEIQELPIPPMAGSEDYQYLIQNYGPWVPKEVHAQEIVKAPVSGAESRSFRVMTWLSGALLLMLTGAALTYFLFLKQKNVTEKASSTEKALQVPSEHRHRQSWQEGSKAALPASIAAPPAREASIGIPKALPVEE